MLQNSKKDADSVSCHGFQYLSFEKFQAPYFPKISRLRNFQPCHVSGFLVREIYEAKISQTRNSRDGLNQKFLKREIPEMD